jgi:hypothetical protein
VVAGALPFNTVDIDNLVPPTSCVYVASDGTLDDTSDAEEFIAPVLPETAPVMLAVAIVLPSKSEGTVASGASPLESRALLPVIVTISTEVLSNCAVTRLASHRKYNGPILVP